jgi:hypothetical protein
MNTYSLYNNTVEITFDPDKHKYTANGADVSSVTQVLKVIAKPALVFWSASMAANYVAEQVKPGIALDEMEIQKLCDGAKKAHRQKAQDSADLGGAAHRWFEDYFSGRKPARPVNADLQNMTDAFLTFVGSHDIQPISLEQRLYSVDLKVAGTADLIAIIDGELTVADYKTTRSGIYPEALLQLGAYDLLYTEEQEFLGRKTQPITNHVIINCNKDGNLYIYNSKATEQNKAAFVHALGLHNGLKLADTDKKLNTVKLS